MFLVGRTTVSIKIFKGTGVPVAFLVGRSRDRFNFPWAHVNLPMLNNPADVMFHNFAGCCQYLKNLISQSYDKN